MKIKTLIVFLVLPVIAFSQKITLSSELRQIGQIYYLPEYRTNTVEGEETTYDRKGGNDDGFAGTYSFVHRNPDSSLVMLDIDGPGVLNRIATPTPTKDTLDFYIDHATKPALSICYRDLFSGKVYPFIKPLCDTAVGGYFSYFPILFQTHLKIVSRGHHLQFHQLGYRLFPKGTSVVSFHLPLSEQDKSAIERLPENWNRKPPETIAIQTVVPPGEQQDLYQSTNGGRILGIEMDTAGTQNLRIQVTWDKESRPAIDCPLREFFGYAFGQPGMHGLLSGTNDRHYCYFPMPFDKSAEIVLINEGPIIAKVNASFSVSAVKRNIQTEGKFYVAFNHNTLTRRDPYHVFLDIRGKGHYVGTILKARGYAEGVPVFFEGDDTTATDGKFRMHGTGSEDYFNGGWYDVPGRWEHAESRPLSGCMSYGHEPTAHTGGFRFFVGDKIPFEQSFFHAIEHGFNTVYPMAADYTSLSFYYCDRGKAEQARTRQ